jgi:predicted Zn-dependent protease with MMP-like domain
MPPITTVCTLARRSLAAALLLSGAAGALAAGAFERVRQQEIAQCLPQEIATWGDGRDRRVPTLPALWAYRHDGAPPWFDAPRVLAAMQRAAEAWSACGATGAVVLVEAGARLPDAAVLVQWSDGGSRGNFGLAHLGERTLALGPAAFRLLDARNPAHPAGDTLQMVLSHEMGHFFGLMAHSRRCVDVMSYYTGAGGERCSTRDGHWPTGTTDYRALLPTACDIARCQALNPATTTALVR